MGFNDNDDDFDFFDFQKENEKVENNNLQKFNSFPNMEDNKAQFNGGNNGQQWNDSHYNYSEQPKYDSFINNNNLHNSANNNGFGDNNNNNNNSFPSPPAVYVKKYPKVLIIVLCALVVISMIGTICVVFCALDTISYYKETTRAIVYPDTVEQVAQSVANNQIDTVVRVKANTNTAGTSYSAGSGFAINSDGYIVTNFHVVENSVVYNNYENKYVQKFDISVAFYNKVASKKEEYVDAKFMYGDASVDVAILKVDVGLLSSGLPEIHYISIVDNSDDVKMGEIVVALGNPGDMGFLLSCGYVSSPSCPIYSTDYKGYYLITDATINHGNSGGPLINSKGEVVGINTFSITQTASGTEMKDINCAIKANDLMALLDSWSVEYTKGSEVNNPTT